jgi:hypothetical protein
MASGAVVCSAVIAKQCCRDRVLFFVFLFIFLLVCLGAGEESVTVTVLFASRTWEQPQAHARKITHPPAHPLTFGLLIWLFG